VRGGLTTACAQDDHDDEEDVGATIHEVWVKRIVVIEETMRIPIVVLRLEVADVDESIQKLKRKSAAREVEP
jgi:hypothetical protein